MAHKSTNLDRFSLCPISCRQDICSANVRTFASLKGIGHHEGRKDKPDSVWSNPDKSGQPFQKKNHNEKLVNEGARDRVKAPQKRLDFGSRLPHFLIIMGSKKAGCPIFNQEKQGQNSSNPARTRQTATEDMKWKNPEKPQFFGVFEHF